MKLCMGHTASSDLTANGHGVDFRELLRPVEFRVKSVWNSALPKVKIRVGSVVQSDNGARFGNIHRRTTPSHADWTHPGQWGGVWALMVLKRLVSGRVVWVVVAAGFEFAGADIDCQYDGAFFAAIRVNRDGGNDLTARDQVHPQLESPLTGNGSGFAH